MVKLLLLPNTTFYPAAVVLITSGESAPNVMTCNRIASCSAEPPRLAISVRPSRFTHHLIQQTGDFVVNIPTQDQLTLTDYLGVVTGKEEDKIAQAGLRLSPGHTVRSPLLDGCPVNIECRVEQAIDLDSHTMFIGLVQVVHAEEAFLDTNGDVDLDLVNGIVYACGTVRERPTFRFRVDDLRQAVRAT